MMKTSLAVLLGVSCSLAAFAATAGTRKTPPKLGDPPESENVRLVGHNDLEARSAYQPIVHKQGDRYIAYIGHHGGTTDTPKPVNPLTGQPEFNGTSIVDVTDPKHPKYLAHIPGAEGLDEAGGGQMVRACDGKDLPKGDKNAVYLLRTFGGMAHEIYDVADPAKPKLITRLDGLSDTHKSFWECKTGIAFLVSGAPGWRVKRMTQVYDLSDPAKPIKIRDFGTFGQEPGSTGPIPMVLHGGISMPDSNRVYLGYGTNKEGMLQILDREKLIKGAAEPTKENLIYPEVGRLQLSAFNGAHTVFPMLKMNVDEYAKETDGKTRDFAMIVDEEIVNECREPRQMVWFADITVENRPMIVSSWTVPEKSGNFCDRGGRFGSHSSNEAMDSVFYKKLAMITFFNAGLRVLDVRNPYQPKEVGYFIPSITKNTYKRCVKDDKGADRCKVAIQSNNVETDDRGYIYVVDRANTGMHILELTGEARKIAGMK
jgi:hypothetical protein